MKTSHLFAAALVCCVAITHLAMARNAQYDEEARAQEKAAKEMRKSEKAGHSTRLVDGPKNMLKGVKQATVDSTAGFIADTAEGTAGAAPVVGNVEAARKGTEGFLDNTVRGVSKVATLGYGEVDNYTIEEPESGTDEPTKIKIKIPGT